MNSSSSSFNLLNLCLLLGSFLLFWCSACTKGEDIVLKAPRLGEANISGQASVNLPPNHIFCAESPDPIRFPGYASLEVDGIKHEAWIEFREEPDIKGTFWFEIRVRDENCFGKYQIHIPDLYASQLVTSRSFTLNQSSNGGYSCPESGVFTALYSDTLVPGGDFLPISFHIFGHDAPLARYYPDTNMTYSPRLIFDEVYLDSNVIKGRFAGDFYIDPTCTHYNTQYPRTLRIENGYFETTIIR